MGDATKMKIGVYTPYLDTLSGGEKYMLTIASYLSQKHDVDILWNPDEEVKIKETAKTKLSLDLANISFVPSLFASSVSFWERMKKSSEYNALIILSDGSLPIVNTSLFVHIQHPIPWVSGKSLKNQLKKARVKDFFCNSEFTKHSVDHIFGVKSRVIYPPVTIEKTHESKKHIILTVGRFGKSNEGALFKKQDVMIDAFNKLCDQEKNDWELRIVISVMASQKEQLTELTKRAEGYPISFIINPTHEELWKEYGQASIYWHASGFGEDLEKNPERAEHFGITTVEAMGAGCVPIVINAGGQVEIVTSGKDGYLWNTKDELISMSLDIMHDDKKRNALIDAARKRAGDFSKDKFESEIEKMIGKL